MIVAPIEQWWEWTSHLITEQSGRILGGSHIVVVSLLACLPPQPPTHRWELHPLSNHCLDWERHPLVLATIVQTAQLTLHCLRQTFSRRSTLCYTHLGLCSAV